MGSNPTPRTPRSTHIALAYIPVFNKFYLIIREVDYERCLDVQCVLLEVESKGCPSCIATIIPHLLQLKGVRGARVQGRFVVVLLDDEVDVDYIIKNTVINDYYRIKAYTRLGSKEECAGRRIYKLL
ncbi:MAG: hypothetical protein QXH78_02255 [Desulfurococcaceae archaeon]